MSRMSEKAIEWEAQEERMRDAGSDLYEALKPIADLMADPQPGLVTWHELLGTALRSPKIHSAIKKAEGHV